jgi:glycosyltransferase involved in cell wall biosynthesis
MRVLMNVDDLGPLGGVEQHVFQTARDLARRGHHIDLQYCRDGGYAAEARLFCASVTAVNSFNLDLGHPVSGGRQVWPAVRAGRQCRPDVIYVNRFSDLAWAFMTARARRARVVCHLHFFRAHRATGLRAFPARQFIAVSRALAAQWEGAGLHRSQISVVPNGIDPDAFPPGGAAERSRARAALGLPPDAFVVLYCGRFHTEKGVDVLLDAWRCLGLGDHEARLLLVGSAGSVPGSDGYYRQLLGRADAGCEWLPARENVLTPMHAADVVVVPSRSESFGRVVIEAMATGRPVLASRVGGVPEVLTGEFARFLVPPDEPGQLAAALRGLIGWQQREPELAEACTAHVRAHFTAAQAVDLVEDILDGARLGR